MRAEIEACDARPQPFPYAFRDGYESVDGSGFGCGQPQDAVQIRRFESSGYLDFAGFAVFLYLLAYVDAGHAVAAYELERHERVPFALAHAGGEGEFEQEHP